LFCPDSGHQLRIDDPTALKSLVALLQPAIAKAGGQDKLSIRTKFMIETLTNLKNNRLKSSAASSTVITESTIRMKKLLGGLSNRNLRATEPLRASLDDIRNTETKGKWWLVGASWVGGTNTTPTSQDGPTENTQISDSEDDETSIPDLHALARQHRMNTDIRRAIFVTLLSSSDYAEAHTRLLKLRLKRSQEREIPRVLLHCAVGEQSYNPYYTLVARKFCCAHPMRMAFTFALWGYFRRFGEDDGSNAAAEFDDDDDVEKDAWSRTEGLRKIVNLARLYGSLVSDGSLGLSILKTLSWGYLQSPTKTFLEVFFATVFVGVTTAIDTNTSIFTSTTHSKDGVERVFSKTAENLDLVRGVLYFLKKNKALKMAETAVGKKDKETVKRGVTAARGLLGGFLNELVVVDG
jgi:nucleolar MIF4G domain-containing protein 1